MTEEWTPIDFGQTEDTTKNIIKVIGVGGGGCNAVKNMYSEGIVNVSFAVCNTDSQSLSKSPVPVKIMLGKSGLGAGANPEVGRSEAQNTQEDIQRLLNDGTKMAFVTAGMGGGTGTGAAPVIAGIAKSMGILTVGIITIPFYFEKRKKIVKALQGVEEMRKKNDFYRDTVKSLVQALILEIARLNKGETVEVEVELREHPAIAQITPALDYVSDNYKEKLVQVPE